MFLKGLALFFLGAGVFVLMQIITPFMAFKVWEITAYDKSQLLEDPTPVSLSGSLVDGGILGVSVASIDNFPAFIGSKGSFIPYSEFKLSVPKLNLSDVKVKVSSNDFEQNLAHLPGSALPGERGNVFITGHSSLPFTPGSKKIAFFVNLPSIKKGDEIFIEALGQKFSYVVAGMKIVDPKDISVINPPDKEGRYLTLMTCVPPGFNTKRLIVLARLKS